MVTGVARGLQTRWRALILSAVSSILIDLSDWDGDGFLDLLVGDDDGLITVFVNADIASGLDELPAVKHLDFELAQNYPNPFNPATTFSYVLPEQARVSLSVYSLNGTLLETLIDAQQDAGSYSVQWHAGDYPSGVYFYRLQAGDYNAVKKCTLNK